MDTVGLHGAQKPTFDTPMTSAPCEGSVNKKLKRIKKEEIPQAFDLDCVNFESVTYLPGGIDRALHDAQRNRDHTFRGIPWTLGEGLQIRPNDWILLPAGEANEDWWLVYTCGQYDMIIVSQGGGYLRLERSRALKLTLDIRHDPPWDPPAEG